MSDTCRGATVLDLGCAEGLVSNLVEYGASLIRGVDGISDRVKEAGRSYGELSRHDS